ncbi:MAG: hypothetical protein RLZZ611_2647 [Cyanobacteriota bacterium]
MGPIRQESSLPTLDPSADPSRPVPVIRGSSDTKGSGDDTQNDRAEAASRLQARRCRARCSCSCTCSKAVPPSLRRAATTWRGWIA